MRFFSKVKCGLKYLLAKTKVKVKNVCQKVNPSNVDWDLWIDRLIDPIIWVVDNFSGSLGLIFVSIVWLLIVFIVGIAYWLGIPYYWNTSIPLTVVLIVLGHWILLNVVFHYYMALKTPPGHPPLAAAIPHVSARCKKCSAAKPPRTHHCSICKTCILRMDHHCPWLNNCVGHFNHRYFYLFMAYVVLGMIFLYIFGAPVLFYELSADDMSEPIGQRVIVNGTHILPLEPEDETRAASRPKYRRGLIITEAILCSGILAALGAMVSWHGKLITNGETSIENLTNKYDREAMQNSGKSFINPYDHGPMENWRIFLGLADGRSWACVFFPSVHSPRGNGIDWEHSVHSDTP